MDWQPIETAPKGNRAILVWVPENSCVFCATWVVSHYDEIPSGWRVFGFGVEWHSSLQHASHWMPTPEGPNVEGNRPVVAGWYLG